MTVSCELYFLLIAVNLTSVIKLEVPGAYQGLNKW